jgi:N-acetylmuramoyl-L-alanine amidase
MWTAFLAIFACLASTAFSQCIDVTRDGWGARPPTSTSPIGTRVRYIIHHSVTSFCYTQTDCAAQMRSIQNYHMDSNG